MKGHLSKKKKLLKKALPLSGRYVFAFWSGSFFCLFVFLFLLFSYYYIMCRWCTSSFDFIIGLTLFTFIILFLGLMISVSLNSMNEQLCSVTKYGFFLNKQASIVVLIVFWRNCFNLTLLFLFSVRGNSMSDVCETVGYAI